MNNSEDLWLGADPGKHGAVVLINAKRSDVIMIPTKVSGGRIDVEHLYHSILPYNDRIRGACMEQVHAIFGSSAKSTFEFGDANGCLRAVLHLLSEGGKKYKVLEALPKLWQKIAWNGIEKIETPHRSATTGKIVLLKSGKPRMDVNTKATSSRAAHHLFPGVEFVPPRCRVEHDGCVDAALIAVYAYVKTAAAAAL